MHVGLLRAPHTGRPVQSTLCRKLFLASLAGQIDLWSYVKSGFSALVCACQQVHEIPCRFLVSRVLECHAEFRRGSHHVQQAPEREAPTPVALQSEVDPHSVDARLHAARIDIYEVSRAEVSKEQVVKFHRIGFNSSRCSRQTSSRPRSGIDLITRGM